MCRTQVRFSQSELSFACPASASGSELFDPTQASISRRLAGLFCLIDLMRSVLGLAQVASVLGPLPGARACHLSLSSSFAVLFSLHTLTGGRGFCASLVICALTTALPWHALSSPQTRSLP